MALRPGERDLQIGITGGVGSGKSTVGFFLKSLGFSCLDADELAHQALQKESALFPEVVRIFGEGILTKERTIDRRVLAQRVFAHAEERKQLEALVHPEVGKKIAATLKERGTHFFLIPLLYEAGMEALFTEVWVVFCTEAQQMERLSQREPCLRRSAAGRGWTVAEIRQRMNAQLPLQEKMRRARRVIDNRGSMEETENQVRAILQELHLLPIPIEPRE